MPSGAPRPVYSATSGLTLSLPGAERAAVRVQCITLKNKVMEFLNRIELRGVVGRADVNLVNGSHVCNFSVVTEYGSRDKEGNPVTDIVWFNVSAWEGREQIADVFQIQKGMWVEVTGRVRIRRYLTQENEERSVMDVMARKVKILPREEDQMQPQRDY